MLVLKVVDSDMTSHGGFRWPESGPVECPDWDPGPVCGGGLHGWARGEGDYVHHLNHPTRHRWLVVDVPDGSVVDLNGKVKFPRGLVVFCGDKRGAVAFMIAAGGLGTPGIVCLDPGQCAEFAGRCAARAAHAARAAASAAHAARAAAHAARAAAYAASAAAGAAAYADAAASDYAAAYAADDAANAAYAAADAADASYAAEREAQRLDILNILGVNP